jgi:hypothetical protein
MYSRLLRAAVSSFALLTAVPTFATPMWTNGLQRISAIIWIQNYHGFYVESGTFHDPQACGNTTSMLYVIDPTTEQDTTTTNRLFALVMSAQAQGKTVYVYVSGCSNSTPVFSGLQLNN